MLSYCGFTDCYAENINYVINSPHVIMRRDEFEGYRVRISARLQDFYIRVYSFLASGLMVVFKRLARLIHIHTVPISNPSYPDLRFS